MSMATARVSMRLTVRLCGSCLFLLSLGQQVRRVRVLGESKNVLGGREKHAGGWSVVAQMILLLWHALSPRVERWKD